MTALTVGPVCLSVLRGISRHEQSQIFPSTSVRYYVTADSRSSCGISLQIDELNFTSFVFSNFFQIFKNTGSNIKT